MWGKEENGLPTNVYALYRGAKSSKCWIYHRETKKYFTPEEFLSEGYKLYFEAGKRNNYEDFALKKPMAAIKERASWVAIANRELQDILDKMERYREELKK